MNVPLKGCIFLFLVISANAGFVEENEEYLRFPPNFLLGAATAAYQIEGAWNVSDKGESTWDRYSHYQDGRIENNDTGDVAANSYYKYKEDVAIMKKLGLNSYRFSVSWPRILPNGFANVVSKDGIQYYKNLIDELLANDIEPMLTLYHWDHPQIIEDAGGWLNPQIVDWFGDFARVVYKELGPKVKKYITINEPGVICTHGYSGGHHAPGKKLHGIGEYLCVHHVLKAHARAYRIYEEEFKDQQKGEVGVNINISGYFPKHENDTLSMKIAFEFNVGWVLHPLYSKTGDYPELMKKMIAERSRGQGYPRSRLPEFEPEWIEYIKGASDFITINHYTSSIMEPGYAGEVPSHANDQGVVGHSHPSWKSTVSNWLKVIPAGFRVCLNSLAENYGNPVMYVVENGVSDRDGTNDVDRIDYYHDYVKEMLKAIYLDGVNVRGYLLWSLLDNFEWARGYSERFGIVHIDFKSPNRTRTLKKSALWWQKVIASRKVQKFANNY